MKGELLAAGLAFLVEAAPLWAAATPTPTPLPKLSGGFGRPRATAVPTAVAERGQSLADVVRAAHQTRESGAPEKSALTIDNRSLVKSPEKGRVSTSQVVAAPPPKASDSPSASTAAAGGLPAEPASSADGEARWREIARAARKRVEDDKARVGELEATARKLENDFYAWDDGQYRDRVIKPAWDRARAELEESRRQLLEAETELADLPERARKAGALPGWIRE